MRHLLLLSALFLVAAPVRAAAQTTVAGTVADADTRAGLRAVEVLVSTRDGVTLGRASTDDHGRFSVVVDAPDDGLYVSVAHAGWRAARTRVRPGAQVRLTLRATHPDDRTRSGGLQRPPPPPADRGQSGTRPRPPATGTRR
jgi:hypothetical protein